MKGNIKEERMMVLSMVQEGKITVEEATKLLDTLSAGSYEDPYYQYSYDFEDKINKFAKSVDVFARDMGDKMQTTFKDVEPKVKKATKTVVEKAVDILDDISKSLNETVKNLDENLENENCGDDDQPKEN